MSTPAPDTPLQWTRDAFLVSADPSRLDPRAVHAFLASSYWAAGIPLSVVERALRHSLCVGLYDTAEPNSTVSLTLFSQK